MTPLTIARMCSDDDADPHDETQQADDAAQDGAERHLHDGHGDPEARSRRSSARCRAWRATALPCRPSRRAAAPAPAATGTTGRSSHRGCSTGCRRPAAAAGCVASAIGASPWAAGVWGHLPRSRATRVLSGLAGSLTQQPWLRYRRSRRWVSLIGCLGGRCDAQDGLQPRRGARGPQGAWSTPSCGKDVVALGMAKGVTVADGRVAFTLELATPAHPAARAHPRRGRAGGRRAAGRERRSTSPSAPT